MNYYDREFIVDTQIIKQQINILKGIADEVYYSYKTNPILGDYINKNSLAALSINLPESLKNINKNLNTHIYYLQGETKEIIKQISEKGITKYIVDNENDLQKLLEVVDPSEIQLRVKFREHTFYTGKYFVFGIDWKKIPEIIKKYELDKKVEIGLHFHRKTQNVGEWHIVEEFENLFPKQIQEQISKVNIGGGIPYKYINSQPDLEHIIEKIKGFREYLNNKNISLVVEPGRFIAAPSVKLKTTILNIYDNNIIVNASIYNAYMDTYLLHHRLEIEGETKNGAHCYTIKGYTLDSLDIFRYKVCFNEKKEMGENLVFLNVGAYNFHCNFNLLPQIPYKFI